MDVGRRLKLGLLAMVAFIGVTMALTTVAQARTIPDPMLTNIPYLAWRGEEVRVVKCAPADLFPGAADPASLNVDFALVDWSGDPHLASPAIESGTFKTGIRGFDGAFCFGITIVSQKAGLANLKLVVSDATGTKLLVHDFLIGWMNLNSIVLCNNSSAGLCTGPTTTTVEDTAGVTTPNTLEANVTGNIPLLQDYNELGIGHPITIPDGSTVTGLVMPNDWATLANSGISTFRGTAGPASFWDIHDDTLATEGHAQESPAGICTPHTAVGVDAVDQCSDSGSLALANEAGGFSSIYQFPTGNLLSQIPSYGPFDPTRAAQTYLGDGKLDAGDAPMPAARIDFTIAPNTGGATDISGVGSFTKIDKGLCRGQSALNDPGENASPFGCTSFPLYVRPGATTPHHLYAPFYRTWLPATAAPADPFSSGIDAGFANNFNGFLNTTGNALDNTNSVAPGLYDYWDIAEVLNTSLASATKCLFPLAGQPVGLLPGGPALDTTAPSSVVVYSDEHGEARVGFLPGTGFFFNALVPNINANLGCDLAGISPLGTAGITATARYPFEGVTAQPLVSNTVAKSVASLFVKLIQCFPKGTSAFDQQTAVCVAHAQDITGAPFVDERVCFFAGGGAEGIFLPNLASITIPNQTTWPAIGIDSAPSLNSPNSVCAFTDIHGNTAVEVFNSDAETVNVGAFFVDEGLMRSVHVTFPITAPTVQVTGPVAASANTTSTHTSNTQVPLTGTTSTSGNGPATAPSTQVDKSVKILYRVTFARLNGKVLRVKLSGPNGRAMLAITALTKSKKLTTMVRAVPANKIVKLRLQLPSGIQKLRLSVMPG